MPDQYEGSVAEKYDQNADGYSPVRKTVSGLNLESAAAELEPEEQDQSSPL